jgi:osmotically-inducible protein OsmY
MATLYTDGEVRQNVWDELAHDVRIDSTQLRITVIDGVIYLDGTVPTYSEKVTAVEDARRIKGVLDVVNRLSVTPARTWTDAETYDSVRRSLDRDARISDPSKSSVAITNGVITLTGTVPSYAQKVAAGDDAWTAPGVVDVINDIIVVPRQPRSDTEIEADVRRALDSDPDINAARIVVIVVNGAVNLRGSVPTYYQVQKAADDAWTVLGVVNVVNELSAAT